MKIKLEESSRMNNGKVIHCEKVDKHQKYAICLMNYQVGLPNNFEQSFAECRPHLRCGECPAMKMRKEEIAAGHALYYEQVEGDPFQPKTKPDPSPKFSKIDKSSYSYLRGRYGPNSPQAKEALEKESGVVVVQKPKTTVEPKPKKVHDHAPIDLHAELVKKAAAPKPNPGESPIEYLKRLRKEAV